MGSPMYAHPPKELDTLSAKFTRIQTEYEQALLRGDAERIHRCQLQMRAITAERDALTKRLVKESPGAATGLLCAAG